ncbi:MAG TPA: TraB/GumN family protein [Caulobacteraceae bacterium]|nr:TraB/GumN family protein [Caulobacteraceae bacterium]
MNRIWRLVLVAVFLALAGGAAAVAPTADPEATVVQELVVTAKAGGPAWWRVSSGAATVYVLGVPEALPRGLRWDMTLTRRRLAGAHELIEPPVVTAGLGDLFALLNARRHFRSRGPMENALPADLRARFLAERPRVNGDPRAYSGWTPLVAGLLMVSDFRRRAGLQAREPAGTVTRLARGMGVKVVPAGSFRAVSLVRAAETGLGQSGPACLADALDEIDAGAGQVRSAAEGWAHGNVAAALAAQRGYEKCLNSLPEGLDIATRSMSVTTQAIAGALATPGHSVAVVNLRTLLAQGGVLQQLQARGYTVARPGE